MKDHTHRTQPRKIVTIIIEEDGTQTFLKTDSADIFLECGETLTRRASHVEPADWARRVAFTVLRFIFPDTGRVAAWTRTWRGPWLVDTTPTAGVLLDGSWMNRQDAIEAEVAFLNDWFVRR